MFKLSFMEFLALKDVSYNNNVPCEWNTSDSTEETMNPYRLIAELQ